MIRRDDYRETAGPSEDVKCEGIFVKSRKRFMGTDSVIGEGKH